MIIVCKVEFTNEEAIVMLHTKEAQTLQGIRYLLPSRKVENLKFNGVYCIDCHSFMYTTWY